MEDNFYTIDQIAEMLGMHQKTIRKFITEGKLGASKVGKQWRISGHNLSVFMEKNNVKISNEKSDEELSIDYSTTGERQQRVNVSTLVGCMGSVIKRNGGQRGLAVWIVTAPCPLRTPSFISSGKTRWL